MRVKELIEKLKEFDEEMEVIEALVEPNYEDWWMSYHPLKRLEVIQFSSNSSELRITDNSDPSLVINKDYLLI